MAEAVLAAAEFLPQNVSGAAMALVNSAGAVGGFVGAYAVGWLQGGLGNGTAFTFMAACLFLSAVAMFAVSARGRRGTDLRAGKTREATA